MKTYAILTVIALLLVIAACAPAAAPSFERTGEQVDITVQANEDLFDATLHVSPAETTDERCVDLSGPDIACVLGDIPAGDSVHVRVTSPNDPAELSCLLLAYLEPGPLASYRPYPCSTE